MGSKLTPLLCGSKRTYFFLCQRIRCMPLNLIAVNSLDYCTDRLMINFRISKLFRSNELVSQEASLQSSPSPIDTEHTIFHFRSHHFPIISHGRSAIFNKHLNNSLSINDNGNLLLDIQFVCEHITNSSQCSNFSRWSVSAVKPMSGYEKKDKRQLR